MMIIAFHPSNPVRTLVENIAEIIRDKIPLSLNKYKNETTPTMGGVASGIKKTIEKKFL